MNTNNENIFMVVQLKIKIFLLKILKSSLIKKGITFTLFAILNNALNFFLIFVLSIYLSKSDFGLLNLFNVLILIVSVLISLGTQSYFGIAFFQNKFENLLKFLNSILIITFLVSIAFLMLIVAAPGSLSNLLGLSTKYQLYVLILCLFQVFYTINLEVFRLEEKPISYGLLSFIWITLNFALTISLCIWIKNGWTGRVHAQLISALVMFIINIIILNNKKYVKFVKPQKKHFTQVLSFGLPLVPHNSTIWIRQGFDRYIINYFYGAVLVGTFSFAYNLSGIILMIGTAFNSTNSVYIYKKLTSKSGEVNALLFKQIYFMTLLFAIITICGYFFSYFFIILFIPKYLDSIQYLFPLFLAAFFQCIYYLFVNYLLFYKNTKTLMLITFSISILHFILSFFLTKYSILFTAYLSLISNFLICLSVIFFTNKTIKLINFKSIMRLPEYR